MRQADVTSLFLKQFGAFFPRLSFRGIKRFPGQTRAPYDFALRVGLGESKIELDLIVAVLGEGYPKDVERLLARVAEAEPTEGQVPCLPALVAPYFTDDSRELCRRQGVGCFDLAGNALVESDQVYLSVMGRENSYLRERQANSPFRGKAELVVRRLLMEPDQRWSMRRLAKASSVSLGLTSSATSTLAEMGFCNKTRQGMDLYNRAGLLEAWAEEYDMRMNAFRVYKSSQSPEALARRLAVKSGRMEGSRGLTLWSGASALFDGELTGGRLALYHTGQPEELAQALGLVERGGETSVFVFQPYDESLLWDLQETPLGISVVHPLQLYLDLACGEASEQELARRVKRALLGR